MKRGQYKKKEEEEEEALAQGLITINLLGYVLQTQRHLHPSLRNHKALLTKQAKGRGWRVQGVWCQLPYDQ